MNRQSNSPHGFASTTSQRCVGSFDFPTGSSTRRLSSQLAATGLELRHFPNQHTQSGGNDVFWFQRPGGLRQQQSVR